MTQFATLQLKNHAGTETPFTVEGINYQTNVASWVYAGVSYDASQRTTFSMLAPSARQTRARLRLKVAIPIMDPINPARKIDELIGNVELVLPKGSSLADRRLLRAYVADLLTDVVVVNAVENFESVY
jgi:hypothetical protein